MKNLIFLFSVLAFLFGDVNTVIAQADNGFEARLDANDDGRKDPPGAATGGTPVVRPGGGGGMSDIAIQVDWADMSNMLAKRSELNWNGVLSAKGYLVQVGEDVLLSRDFVFSAKTKKPSISIPLNELALEKGKTYYVKVTDLADSDNVSKKAKFKIITKAAIKKSMTRLRKSETYTNADAFKQKMMKAYQLEQDGLMYDASKMYDTYEEDDANDATLRNLRDVFRKNAKILF